MNPHDGFIEHRVEYATPILDETDLATFEAHLVHCEDCRREVSGSRRTWLRGSGLHWRVRSLAVILLTSHPLSGP